MLSDPFWRTATYFAGDMQTHTIYNESIKFHSDTVSEVSRFFHLAGEEPIIADLLFSLSFDDTFYDIGANVGTYTCFAASKLGSEKVVAFEPEPKNAARLRDNLELNDLNAKILEVAVTNKDGKQELGIQGDEAGEGEHTVFTEDSAKTIEVDSFRVDTLIKERGVQEPTVIKVDVEGAELSVLQGMEKTLNNHVRLIYAELHPKKSSNFGYEIAEVEEYLRELGFEVSDLSQRGGQKFIRATK